jgi:hypothetical protein
MKQGGAFTEIAYSMGDVNIQSRRSFFSIEEMKTLTTQII